MLYSYYTGLHRNMGCWLLSYSQGDTNGRTILCGTCGVQEQSWHPTGLPFQLQDPTKDFTSFACEEGGAQSLDHLCKFSHALS